VGGDLRGVERQLALVALELVDVLPTVAPFEQALVGVLDPDDRGPRTAGPSSTASMLPITRSRSWAAATTSRCTSMITRAVAGRSGSEVMWFVSGDASVGILPRGIEARAEHTRERSTEMGISALSCHTPSVSCRT